MVAAHDCLYTLMGVVLVQVLYWLSGLTCTDENFITKAGAQRYAEARGVALVCPDTSPRGAGIAGEDDSYDFGSGAWCANPLTHGPVPCTT